MVMGAEVPGLCRLIKTATGIACLVPSRGSATGPVNC